MSRFLYSSLSLVLTGVLLWVLINRLDVNLAYVTHAIKGIDFQHGAMFVATLAITILLSNERWLLLSRADKHNSTVGVGRLVLFLYSTMGSLLGQLLPMPIGMAVMREAMVRVHSFAPLGRTTIFTLHEYLFDLTIMACVSVVGWVVLSGVVSVAHVDAMLGFAIMVGCAFLIGLLALRSRLEGDGRNVDKVIMAAHLCQMLPRINLTDIYLLAGISLLRLLFVMANIMILADYMWGDVSNWQLLVSYAIGQMSILLPLTPGGAGILELTWSQCFMLMGYSAPKAAEFVLVLRVYGGVGLVLLLAAVWLLAWVRSVCGRGV